MTINSIGPGYMPQYKLVQAGKPQYLLRYGTVGTAERASTYGTAVRCIRPQVPS